MAAQSRSAGSRLQIDESWVYCEVSPILDEEQNMAHNEERPNQAQRKAWLKPELKRIHAGSAEDGGTGPQDGIGGSTNLS